MPQLRLIFIVLFLVCIGLGVYLANLFYQEIQRERHIEQVEKKVKEKLKIIQAAQIAHLRAEGSYAGEWPELVDFIKNGRLVVTQKREETVGAYDSIRVIIDTLHTVPVRDSIFPRRKFPDLDIDNLPVVPGSNKTFRIYAGTIDRDGVQVDVFEVVDPDPVNPRRKTGEHPRGPLKIGSRTEPTTTGNWK